MAPLLRFVCDPTDLQRGAITQTCGTAESAHPAVRRGALARDLRHIVQSQVPPQVEVRARHGFEEVHLRLRVELVHHESGVANVCARIYEDALRVEAGAPKIEL